MHFCGNILRRELEKPKSVFAYGVSSAIDAIVASQEAGHKFLYVGGYAASGLNGFPDMGLLTQTEMLEHVQKLSNAINDDVCLIVDIDNGYGGVHNVRRTVYDICTKTRNVAAVHLEDQVIPKRCGHIAGKEILSQDEFLAKLNAAIDMKNSIDPSLVVIARTDAFSAAGVNKDQRVGGDINEAVKRGLAYSRAGADLVWCEFPKPDKLSAKEFSDGMKKFMPILGLAFNISPSFNWNEFPNPIKTVELQEMGYKFLFSTYPSLTASVFYVHKIAKNFLRDPVEALKNLQTEVKGSPAESIKKLVGVDKYQEIEMAYNKDAKNRIESTDGFKK